MPALPRHPRFWLGAFLFWLAALWLLSSFSQTGDYLPPIRYFDKIGHFGFFRPTIGGTLWRDVTTWFEHKREN